MKLTETQKQFRKQMKEIESNSNNKINNSRNSSRNVTFRESSRKLPLFFTVLIILAMVFAMNPEGSKDKLMSLMNIDIIESLGTGNLLTSNDIVKERVAIYIEDLKPIKSTYDGIMSNLNQTNLMGKTKKEYNDLMTLSISNLQKLQRRLRIMEVPEVMNTYHNTYKTMINNAEFLIIQQMNTPTNNLEVVEYKARINLASESLMNTTNMIQPELIRVFDKIGMKYEVYDNYVRFFFKDTNPLF